MYPVHDDLLNFSSDLRQKIDFNGNKVLEFLPSEYHRDDGEVERKEKQEYCKSQGMAPKSELVPFGDFIAQQTASKSGDVEMKVVHRRIQVVLDAIHKFVDDGSDMTKSSSLCWKLVPILVSYHWEIAEDRDISREKHWTMVYRHRI